MIIAILLAYATGPISDLEDIGGAETMAYGSECSW